MKRFVLLAVIASAAAVGGADDLQKNVVPAERQVKRAFRTFGKENGSPRVLYVGNSITRHGPKPDIGWTNDCGMAASSIEKDYVHVNAAMVAKVKPNAEFACLNVADSLERKFSDPGWKPETYFKDVKAFKADIVVFFFGANVAKSYDDDPSASPRSFKDAVLALRDYLDAGKTTFLIAEGFYIRPVLDAEKKAAAAARGDVFVTIDDFRRGADVHGRFNHPNDEGMQRIARRFFEAMATML